MTVYDGKLDDYMPVDPYQRREYYNAITITYGQLVDGGYIDWSRPEFSWDYYDEDQRDRIQKLIEGRFWLREISIIPPEAWRRALIQKLNEAMRQARPMYDAIKAAPDILAAGGEYHKRRSIASDFPATLLNGSTQDYASSGVDLEYETTRDAGLIDAITLLQAGGYQDPDLWILDQLEAVFSQLVSVNINAF